MEKPYTHTVKIGLEITKLIVGNSMIIHRPVPLSGTTGS